MRPSPSFFPKSLLSYSSGASISQPDCVCHLAGRRATMHAPLDFDFLLFHLCLSHSVELQHSGMMASLSMECANRCSPYWTVFLAWKEWKSSSQDVRNSPDGFSSFLLMEFYQLIWCIRAAMSASSATRSLWHWATSCRINFLQLFLKRRQFHASVSTCKMNGECIKP